MDAGETVGGELVSPAGLAAALGVLMKWWEFADMFQDAAATVGFRGYETWVSIMRMMRKEFCGSSWGKKK
jgi:hypothetical protein